jgi:hypothetical protein
VNPHFSRFRLLLLVVKIAGIAVCFVQGPSSVQYSDVEPAEAMILFLASSFTQEQKPFMYHLFCSSSNSSSCKKV